MGTTTVRIHDDTWERLDERKGRNESFDDVIRRALDATEERESRA